MSNITEYNEFKQLAKVYGFDRAVVMNRIIEIAKELVKSSEDQHGSVIMMLAGRIARQCQHCTFDSYWKEKTQYGKQIESWVIKNNYNPKCDDWKFWEVRRKKTGSKLDRLLGVAR